MRRAEPVAGLGGALLLVALFQPWYGDETGWEALSVIDVLLAILALLALAVPVVTLATSGPAKSIGTAVIASAVGWLAILLVVFRLLDAPGDVRYGVWLAFAGSILAWVGSWLSMRDDSTPGAVPPEVPRRPAPPATAA